MCCGLPSDHHVSVDHSVDKLPGQEGTANVMTADATERATYFVYVYRIGGVMAYVGSGSGFRMTKHLNASHNPYLATWIARARDTGATVQHRKIKTGLTKREALRLEGRCFEKWEDTLCNLNHPYPALERERDEADWTRFEASEAYQDLQAMLGHPDKRLAALDAFYDGTLSRVEAFKFGFIDADGRVTYGDREIYKGP